MNQLKTRTIGSLVLCAATLCIPQSVKALTLELGGLMNWKGQDVPPAEADTDIVYDASIEFDEALAVAEININTSSVVASGTVDEAEWILLDTPTTRAYLGEEIRLTLIGGDFTTGISEADFFSKVDSVQLEYFPASVSQNFDTSLNAEPIIVNEPAALTLILLPLLFAVAWLRRQQGCSG